MKKYVMTHEFKEMSCGTKVYRIQALRDIGEHYVFGGQMGGFIEKEYNLPQDEEDSSWVSHDAVVLNDSRISGTALVRHHAVVEGDSKLIGQVMVGGKSHLMDTHLEGQHIRTVESVRLFDVQLNGADIHIAGNSNLYNVRTKGTVEGLKIFDDVFIEGSDPVVFGGKNIRLSHDVSIKEGATIVGENIELFDQVSLHGQPTLEGNNIRLEDGVSLVGDVRLGDNCRVKDSVEILENDISFDPVLTDIQLHGDLTIDTGEIYDIMKNMK